MSACLLLKAFANSKCKTTADGVSRRFHEITNELSTFHAPAMDSTITSSSQFRHTIFSAFACSHRFFLSHSRFANFMQYMLFSFLIVSSLMACLAQHNAACPRQNGKSRENYSISRTCQNYFSYCKRQQRFH